MARELDERDKEVLKKLVPELDDMLRLGIELEYMNILPPVANHHSRDEKDFKERLQKLSPDDIKYLVDKVMDGSESLGCLYPEFAEAFFSVAQRKHSSVVVDNLRKVL